MSNALFVKLSPEDRARLNRLAADSGAAEGRPVSVSDVIRQLVREASSRRKPLRLTAIEEG